MNFSAASCAFVVCVLLTACDKGGGANVTSTKIRVPSGSVTNDHIVIARYGTAEDVPGQPGAIHFKPPPPGIKIKFDEPAMNGPTAAMYYFDAILLKEQFTNGIHALYIHTPAVQSMTLDARLGWLTPAEIVDQFGAKFASNGVTLKRLSATTFLAAATNEIVEGAGQ